MCANKNAQATRSEAASFSVRPIGKSILVDAAMISPLLSYPTPNLVSKMDSFRLNYEKPYFL